MKLTPFKLGIAAITLALVAGTARASLTCATGRHPYGTYLRPLVEVLPEGFDNQTEGGVREAPTYNEPLISSVNCSRASS